MKLQDRIIARIPEISLLAGGLLLLYFYGIFLPFFLALALAYGIGPFIQKWQKLLRNWELSVGLFLLSLGLVLVLFLSISAGFIARDMQRFNQSFSLLLEENQSQLDAGAQKVQAWMSEFVDSTDLEQKIREQIASLSSSDSAKSGLSLSMENISAGFSKLQSFFKSKPAEADKGFQLPQFGFWYQFGSFLLYFVLILFYYPYFESLRERYHNPGLSRNWQQFWTDFNQSFVRYFKLRTRIVLWESLLFLVAFLILDLPGTYLYLILIFLLLYIPYLHYLLLIPMALSGLVLSMELAWPYWLVMSIIVGVFILGSILEEALLIPRIMERHIGLNPVIMVLGLSFWTYLLGFTGVLIGIPLTSLGLIYLKRFILPHWFPASSGNSE